MGLRAGLGVGLGDGTNHGRVLLKQISGHLWEKCAAKNDIHPNFVVLTKIFVT